MSMKQLKLGRRGEHRVRRPRPERDPRPVKSAPVVRYHSLSLPSIYTREFK